MFEMVKRCVGRSGTDAEVSGAWKELAEAEKQLCGLEGCAEVLSRSGGRALLGEFKISIFMGLARKLNSSDHQAITELSEKLINYLAGESVRLDPSTPKIRAEIRRDVMDLFREPIFVEEIPNQYDTTSVYAIRSPWFVITTQIGRFRVGLRKRVIHIEWTDTVVNETAERLFPNDDVTRYDRVIHAWNLEKAREYVQTVMASGGCR